VSLPAALFTEWRSGKQQSNQRSRDTLYVTYALSMLTLAATFCTFISTDLTAALMSSSTFIRFLMAFKYETIASSQNQTANYS
jgi:hypothetical protein